MTRRHGGGGGGGGDMDDAEDSSTERAPLLPSSTGQDGCRRRWRTKALLLLLLFSAGANWAEACLGPLKSALMERLDINNAQFGVISASTQLANTLVPFLVVWVDLIGVAHVAIASTACVCIGTLITAFGVHRSLYEVLVLGRIVVGLGVILVDTAATKLLVRWFRPSGSLSLAISLNFAFDRAAAALSKALAVPIANSLYGDPTTTFAVAVAVSVISFAAALTYLSQVQRYEPAHQHTSSFTNGLLQTVFYNTFQLIRTTFKRLPTFFIFLVTTQFYQPIAVFNTLSADIIRWKGSSPEMAGYLASIGQLLPIVLAPCLGVCFDRFGRRMEYVVATAILLAISFFLLGWTNVHPALSMLVFSLGNAINTPPYLCSLAIILRDDDTFGCSWGVWKAFMQSYQIIMNTTLGWVQDQTPKQGYENVLLLLIASKLAEFVWGVAYVIGDQRYMAGILAADDEQRKRIEARMDTTEGARWRTKTIGLRPKRMASLFAASYFIITVLSAWSLFFFFLRR